MIKLIEKVLNYVNIFKIEYKNNDIILWFIISEELGIIEMDYININKYDFLNELKIWINNKDFNIDILHQPCKVSVNLFHHSIDFGNKLDFYDNNEYDCMVKAGIYILGNLS